MQPSEAYGQAASSRKIIKTKRKNYNANQVRRFFSF
jgi:hypothetical protein